MIILIATKFYQISKYVIIFTKQIHLLNNMPLKYQKHNYNFASTLPRALLNLELHPLTNDLISIPCRLNVSIKSGVEKQVEFPEKSSFANPV